jgi:quercetin dioxygenase-like cupin family protein
MRQVAAAGSMPVSKESTRRLSGGGSIVWTATQPPPARPREWGDVLVFRGPRNRQSLSPADRREVRVHRAVVPGGAATPLHSQPEDDESFYVLEGELTFYLEGGQPIRASADSFVHLPGGVPHAFRVNSETTRILNVTTAQHERFFRATSAPALTRTIPPEAPPDIERIGAAAQEYGVGILGPPPGARA